MFGSDSTKESRPPGLLDKGRAILTILIRMVQNRFSIAATGLQEEYERLWPLLIRTLISFVLLSFGMFFLSVWVVVYFWDYKLVALAAISIVYLVTGGFFALHVNHLWSKRRKLFATVLEELEKDIQSLRD